MNLVLAVLSQNVRAAICVFDFGPFCSLASAMLGTLSPAYACGCLNVRITPVPAQPGSGSQQSSNPVSTDFSQVHVADEGIAVVGISLVRSGPCINVFNDF